MNKYILPTIISLLVCFVFGFLIVSDIQKDSNIVNINGFEIKEYNLQSIDNELSDDAVSIICDIETNSCISINPNKINNG